MNTAFDEFDPRNKSKGFLIREGDYEIQSYWLESCAATISYLWRYHNGIRTLISTELSNGYGGCGIDSMRAWAEKETRMKSVIAIKIRGEWAQAELTVAVAEGILKHDSAFEEIMLIEDGKLKRLVKPESDAAKPEVRPDNPAEPQSSPQ